jgi:hypothetical protein
MHALMPSKTCVLIVAFVAGVSARSSEAQSLHLAAVSHYLRPVTFSGAVNKPGTYPVDGNRTLEQLLEMLGGVTRDAGQTAFLIHFSADAPFTAVSRLTLIALTRAGTTLPNITVTRFDLTDAQTRDRQLSLDSQDILFVPSKSEG